MREDQIKTELTCYVLSCSEHNRGILLTEMLDMLIGRYPAKSTNDNFWKVLLLVREKHRNPAGNYNTAELDDDDVNRVLRSGHLEGNKQ
jgi:hypothetical protein